jgi:hypothetical protein
VVTIVAIAVYRKTCASIADRARWDGGLDVVPNVLGDLRCPGAKREQRPGGQGENTWHAGCARVVNVDRKPAYGEDRAE